MSGGIIYIFVSVEVGSAHFFYCINMGFKERKREIEASVRELIEPLVRYEHMELVNVEYIKGPRGPVLRLIIDRDGGVTLDDCTRVSRVASDVLDVHDPVPGSYNLEVSSPGINRPLVRPEDYERFAGQKVLVRTRLAVEGRKKFRGLLRGIRDGHVLLETSTEEFALPLDGIAKARLDIL